MKFRDKLLAIGDRVASAWRILVSRRAKTLEDLSTQMAELRPQLENHLGLHSVNLAAQLQALDIQLKSVDAQVKSLEAQVKTVVNQAQNRTVEHLKNIGDLRGFAWKVYSQNGEDGIIKEIFRRIGTTNSYFVEFGVESGVQCNTRYLAELVGWSGVYFEPSDTNYGKLEAMWRDNPKIQTFKTCITSQNFEKRLGEANVPRELDLLVIDIDSNDYWVWKSLVNWSPRVVVIEYNAFHDPPARWVMKEDLNYSWNQTTYFGASFTSLYLLGKSKGYRLVGTDPMGVNMFFVRQDCMNDQFLDAELHYFFQPFGYTSPPRYDGPFENI